MRDLSKCQGVLRVKPNGQASRSRNFVVLRDIGPTHTLGVYNNNIGAVSRAFEERYFLCKVGDTYVPALTVRPRAFIGNRWLARFKDIVCQHVGKAPVVPLQQVVEAYTGPKRRVYDQALSSLSRDPLTRKDARLTSFVKYEKQDLDKAPRIINPRSPRYNLVLGKYLKFLEKRVYKSINHAFGAHTAHTVIKGLNVVDAGAVCYAKWSRFASPVAVGLDASKFDMHTSQAALKYEHSFYTTIFPHSKELRTILRWQLVNEGTAHCDDGRVEFKMMGTRSSGDLNTSLGNCIIMCSLIYAYKETRGVDVELLNNGDDCVVIMESHHLQRFMAGLSRWFSNYGYRMTVEDPVFEFEGIDFCQSHPIKVDGVPTMVRNTSAVLRKDPMCLVPVPTVSSLRKWLRAVGDCGLSICSGVPVLQSYYKMYQRSGEAYGAGYLKHLFKNTSHLERMRGLSANSTEVLASTRCSFYFATGLLPDYQEELERLFDNAVIHTDVEDAQVIEDRTLGGSAPPSLIEFAF